MLNRWLLAVPLALAGFVVVPLGRAWLWAGGRGEPWSLSELVLRSLPLYAIVAGLLFVVRRSPRYWARLTFLVSVLWAVVGLAAGLPLVWSVASVVLAWWLVHLAARVLTRQLDEELAASGLTVHVKSRTSRLRVEIGRDRVRLVGMAGPAEPPAALRLAIPFTRLAFVEAGTLASQRTGATWKLPNHANVKLANGPAIRIAGPGQEWLVPVDEPGELAAFIRERASRARMASPGTDPGLPDPSVDERRRARVLLERQNDRVSKNIRAYAGGSHHSYLVAAFLVSPAAVAAALHSGIAPSGRVLGFLLFGALAAGAGWYWWRLERAVRLFEEWPRSSDEPSQTIPDEAATPVSGWSSAYPSGMA
ncbi:hypothetical protein [Flindersiella endophytica]